MRIGNRNRLGLSLATLGFTLVACSTSGPPPASQPTEAGGGPTSPAITAMPTPSATVGPGSAPLGNVPRDGGASLSVTPVDYGGQSVVRARFGDAMKGRAVSLQRETVSGWSEVATGVQDRNGRVEFLAPVGEATIRAVALEVGQADSMRKPVATPTTDAAKQWRTALSTDFSGGSLPAPWGNRNSGSYLAKGRQCSAPYESNAKVSGGKVHLSMSKEENSGNIRKAKAAGCKKGEYYRNAMVATEGRFGLRRGIVAARAKFPEGQGMHGALWLQSSVMAEIDFVESYGYGKGLTSVIHADHKRYPVKNAETYVHGPAVVNRAWWDEYHVYSVEWDSSELVFRIDGIETKRITERMPNVDYFLVLSLLSSDWELGRLNDPVGDADGMKPTALPQTMSVDWVKAWSPRG